MRLVGALTGLAVTVVLVLAIIDLRTVAADTPAAAAPAADPAAGAGTRVEDTQQQVAVTVTFAGTGPFTATVVDGEKKERTVTSNGEPVDVTRVFQGPGPHVFASGQLSVDGTISCRVEVDGRKVSSDKQSGIYAQTFCSG